MLSCIDLFINQHAIAIESVTAILTTIATLYISYLTYKNIKESRHATIMADEKKNVIEACKYAIQLILLIEKFTKQLPILFSEKETMLASAMILKRQYKGFQEEISKVKEPLNNKIMELQTVLSFLPEDGIKQTHWLQSYYKDLKAYCNSTDGNILGNLTSLKSKLKEKGLADINSFEPMLQYFHENIKKVIAEKKFSLHNLETVWIPYKQFIKQEEK